MELNEIVFKTKVGNYFWVVTRYQGKGKAKTKGCGLLGIPDIYHTVAHREIYHGPMGGVGDYEGTRITSDEDIEGRHLEMCAPAHPLVHSFSEGGFTLLLSCFLFS